MNNSLLKGKNCLITGATGGIGKEIAKKLSDQGCNLFLVGRNSNKLNNTGQTIENINSNILVKWSLCDLTDNNSIEDLISKVEKQFNHIDLLVNAAGVFPMGKISKMQISDFDNCFNLNVKAPFILTKHFITNMINNKWGRIINIGSSSSYSGFKETSIYCASKHALLGLSRSMHSELKEHGIRTYIISPASVQTDMGKKLVNQDYNTFISPNELAKFIVTLISYDDNMICEEVRLNRLVYR